MHKFRFSSSTGIVICLLLAINLFAFSWTSKLFRQHGMALLRYGDRIPKLEGRGYSGDQTLSVSGTGLNLVIYISPFGLKGQSISLLKFCETLRQKVQGRFQTTLITSGVVPEIQQLLQDKLINYTIIKDSNDVLAGRLGLDAGESGTFFFDKTGLCKFSSRQQPNPEDLRQLLAAEGIGDDDAMTAGTAFGRGKPLPSWSLMDARSLSRVTTTELSSKLEQSWVFFLADCFSCGPPDAERSLKEFNHWRKFAKDLAPDPVMVFDSAFLRHEVVAELDRLAITLPAYVSNDDLSTMSKLALSRGKPTNHPMVVRTDSSGAVISIGLITGSGNSRSADSSPVGSETPTNGRPVYLRTFQNLGLDVYDVDSYNGLYYVSDRTRNCIVVLNERFEVQRVIGGIGSAPGRLFRPGYVDVSEDGVIHVQDGGNERIASFSVDGRYLGGFSTELYMGFAAGTNGEIYLGQPENGALISVYSREGKRLRSFGKLKIYSDFYGQEFKDRNERFANAINRLRLAVDKDGSILVSFMLIPILQKYTREGQLIFERRLEGPELDALRQSPKGLLTMSMDGFAEEIIALEALPRPNGEINIMLTDGSIYVADQNGGRLRVIHPQADANFTPEMTGLTPAGEVLIIGLSPRNCYRLPAS